ncbi:hypothetical protein [Vitiosangium sp. GDMCC 1.1324]|uniref:hypothetical protein n=1 Tax=Vitiosangium sp. (strain GDMCC 1.1324) TaxID=2138576 RepID=UPI000D3B5B92|nr:hypothetical protein [Vitiosangium sp. GDMCC 1.1324]PTL75656.1 hypothetical protein DAT35_53520 [Vitiosangium sp. GDMCC 1.1324]
MKRHAARWLVGGLVGGLVVLGAFAGMRWRSPGAPPPVGAGTEVSEAPSSSEDLDSALREAALARFKNGSVGLRLNDGTRIAPRDADHDASIKVSLFKKLLAQERARKDPAFPRVAEESLRRKRPAEVIVEWSDDVTGSQWIRLTVADTVGCGLGPELTQTIAPGGLSIHPCLLTGSLKGRWTDTHPSLAVELRPLDGVGREWERLLGEEMKELAALDFLREQGHRVAAMPGAGRMESAE